MTIDNDDIKMLEEIEGVTSNTALTSLIGKFKKTQKKITTASAKAKGRNLQQWVCRKISELTDIPYEQSDDQCDIHSREMGQAGCDIILRGEARKLFPFSVECKASESLNLKDTVDQARNNAYHGTDWLIVHNKKAVKDTLVIMSWDTFEKLYRRIETWDK